MARGTRPSFLSRHSAPTPDPDHGGPAPTEPSLRTFLRGRFISGNGLAALLYLLLSVWVLLNPSRAKRVWRRLQGM